MIKNQEYVVVTPQLASMHKKNLGSLVGNLKGERDAIVASLDFLITGF